MAPISLHLFRPRFKIQIFEGSKISFSSINSEDDWWQKLLIDFYSTNIWITKTKFGFATKLPNGSNTNYSENVKLICSYIQQIVEFCVQLANTFPGWLSFDMLRIDFNNDWADHYYKFSVHSVAFFLLFILWYRYLRRN